MEHGEYAVSFVSWGMERTAMDPEKQQRLLLRGISEIQLQLKRALESGLKQDFLNAETLSREFKEFFHVSVTAPEIRTYIQEIPSMPVTSGEPSLLRLMFTPMVSLFSGQTLRASRAMVSKAHEAKAKYGNLEILVRMMEE